MTYPALATALDQARPSILQAYRQRLAASGSPLVSNDSIWGQARAQADAIITDIVDVLRGVEVDFAYRAEVLSETIGHSRAADNIHQDVSLRAAGTLFREVIRVSSDLVVRVGSDQAQAMPMISIALNDSLNARVRQGAASYASFLLGKVHLAQVEERRRIARDLHDRIASEASVAHRQLELATLYAGQPERAGEAVTAATEAIGMVLSGLRQLTSDLRLVHPLENLEVALKRFVGSLGDEQSRVTVRINGDESWAEPVVLDETFLIVREAMRNALTHTQQASVIARVDIAPHALAALVYDNGGGFDQAALTSTQRSGLASMQERAALIGGSLTVTSTAGAGTVVRLLVPLGGERFEQPD
ncbi:sensor histidine kinase [Jatrophihabitans sp.]|uniref:sensor histidine kinase n=1 Tax=Jatrophihabitans sp. TaxID=1932789 RepID=UPI002BF47754|nr:histidine kinase [Jatrophihabitans sp.]